MVGMTIGQYIKRRRKTLHLTQKELSERLKARGVDRDATTLASWESGRAIVPIEYIPQIADALEEESPNNLYDLAGVIENLKGADVVRLLHNATAQDLEYILDLIRVHLKHSKKNG